LHLQGGGTARRRRWSCAGATTGSVTRTRTAAGRNGIGAQPQPVSLLPCFCFPCRAAVQSTSEAEVRVLLEVKRMPGG
jgi:hypothetical protein